MKYIRYSTLLLATLIILISCGDNGTTGTEELSSGSIEVTTQTSGDDVDSDGYSLTIDSRSKEVSASSSVIFRDIQEGNYELELSNMRANCEAENSNPRNISVFAGDTTNVSFNINCLEQAINKIAFHSNRDGDYEIYTIKPDGSQLTKLTSNVSDDKYPVFSNDGTKIAYISDEGGTSSLKVMQVDRTNKRTLTAAESLDNLNGVEFPLSSWSDDDSKLVFSRGGIVYKINEDGSGETRLTEGVNPNWSQSGDQIVYNNYYGTEINIMDSDGSNIQKIAGINDNPPDSSGVPKWSPDGNTLVGSTKVGDQLDIFLIDSDGSNFRMLTNSTTSDENLPSWSPDGSQIVFSADFHDKDIIIVQAETDSNWDHIVFDYADDGAPHWSPVD